MTGVDARSRGSEMMLVRLVVVTVFALLMLLSGVSMATAAPQVIGCQFTNPLAYELKSLLTTRAYFQVSEAGSWARLDILGASGVVKTMYNGPVNQAYTNIWTPLWNGLDATGRRLPSASYDWRLTVNKGGQSTVKTGKITISKIQFVVQGTGDGYHLRYMVPGTANIYYHIYSDEWDWLYLNIYAPSATQVAYGDWDFDEPNSEKGTLYMRRNPGNDTSLYERGMHGFDISSWDMTYYFTVIQ